MFGKNNKQHNAPAVQRAPSVKATAVEYLGTVAFLLIGLGSIQAATTTTGDPVSKILLIAAGMGLALVFASYVVNRRSGSAFNPNVALALMLCGSLNPIRFVMFAVAQILGAITAAAILQGLSPGSIAVNARLVQGTGRTQGVFIEMFVTAALCLVVLQFATNTKARRQDDRDVHGLGNANGTGGLLGGPGDRRGYASSGHRTRTVSHFYPIAIGLTTFACHLWAVAFTGCAMNTARAFGPAVVTSPFANSHWIYWVGPFAGSLLAAAIHHALRFLRSSEVQYEHDLQLNEPQDDFAATRRDTDGIIDDKPRDDLARPVPLATTHGAMSTPTATSHGVRAV